MLEKESCDIMLVQFKFRNHKSFYEETVLDFMASQEKRHSNGLIDVNGNKLLPVIAIHGANASGKTTVLDALWYMFDMVKNSSQVDIQKNLITVPFAFSDKTKDEDSEYEVSLNIGDYEYRYGYSLNANEYVEEWLYRRKFNSTTTESEKLVFERHKNEVVFANNYTKYKNIWNLYKHEMKVNKFLVLSHLAIKEEEGFLRDIYKYMSSYNIKLDFVNESIVVDIFNKNNKLYKKFKKILNEVDPCLIDVEIKEIEKEDGNKSFRIYGVHKSIDNDENVNIQLRQESMGTIKVFNVLPSILISLEEGSLLCIDELDTKLHPLLFKKIVNMYKDKNLNKHNAQLVFTSHNTFMFNSRDLRRDQIYLTEKNDLGFSRLYSLADFKNLRVDANYEIKYLSGQLGAIPFENE